MKKLSIHMLLVLSLLLCSAPVQAGSVKESKTGISFPETQTVWSKEWVLTGAVARIRSFVGIINARVYALGFYMEKEGAATALAAWKGADGKIDVAKAQGDSKFYKAIINCSCGRGADLVFVRELSGPQIRDAFIETVSGELTNLYGISAEDASVKDDMARFADFLNYDVNVGNTLKLYISAKGNLSATGLGGQLTIKNQKIAKAVLASWFGNSPRYAGDANVKEMQKNTIAYVNNVFAP